MTHGGWCYRHNHHGYIVCKEKSVLRESIGEGRKCILLLTTLPKPQACLRVGKESMEVHRDECAPQAKVEADTDQGQATLPLMSLDPGDDEAKPTATWN